MRRRMEADEEDGGERIEVRGGTRRRVRRMGARSHHTRRMEAAFEMEVVFEEDDGGRRGGWWQKDRGARRQGVWRYKKAGKEDEDKTAPAGSSEVAYKDVGGV